MNDSSMRHIVLTVDYEIFGNGTGDVRQHIITPAGQMADIAKQFGMPFTFFIEIEEYCAFLKYQKQLYSKLNYYPDQLIRNQIQNLISTGNDIQLHIHPEWFGARLENGSWVLNRKCSSIDALFETQQETNRYISERKNILEEIIREVIPGRSICAYRAGAFCAQPGRKLLNALADSTILIESSVVKGLHRNDQYAAFDFRKVPPNKNIWRVSDDVCNEDIAGQVFEVPIYSRMGRRFQQATSSRLKAKFSRNIPKNKQREMMQQLGFKWNPFNIIHFLLQKIPIKLDFHNQSPNTLIRWIQSAECSENDVLVLIGHTKEHINNDKLIQFFNKLSTIPDIRVITFNQLTEIIKKNQKTDTIG